jgi:predicted transcriptional regulator
VETPSEGIPMRKRTQLEIMSEILHFCKQPKGKTRVMYHTNLSWKISQAYLERLELKGLLQIHHSPIKYVVTKKGREFIEKIDHLNEFLH